MTAYTSGLTLCLLLNLLGIKWAYKFYGPESSLEQPRYAPAKLAAGWTPNSSRQRLSFGYQKPVDGGSFGSRQGRIRSWKSWQTS